MIARRGAHRTRNLSSSTLDPAPAHADASPSSPIRLVNIMRNALLIALLALPLSSCIVAAAAGGVVLAGEMTDNRSYVAHVDKDAKVVWPAVKNFLSSESAELIEFDDQTRIAKAKLDGANVVVTVEAYDVDRSVLSVSAKKFMSTVNDGELAKVVMERLHRRIHADSK